MEKTVKSRIKIRTDTVANWESKDPVLYPGQISYASGVNRFKVGDGESKWSELPYLNQDDFNYLLNYMQTKAVIVSKTTEEWKSEAATISDPNTLYVYSDHYVDDKGVAHPAMKIGDGKAYVSDLPFASGYVDVLMAHINDKTIHITQEERENWNSKVKSKIDGENLTLYNNDNPS